MKGPSVLRLLGVLVLAAAVACLSIFLPIKHYVYALVEWVQSMGPWGPVLLALSYVLACVLFVPGSLLTVAAGFLFGVPVGTITVSLGSILGAAAAFLVGRTLARAWVQRQVAGNPRFQALDEAVREQGFKIVLLTRLSPAFPFALLNFVFGLTRVSFRDYVLAPGSACCLEPSCTSTSVPRSRTWSSVTGPCHPHGRWR